MSREEKRYHVQMNPTAWDGIIPTDVVKTFKALSTVRDIILTESQDIAPQCIAVEGKVVAMVDEYAPWDSFSAKMTGEYHKWVAVNNPGLILKYQYRRGVPYPKETRSAGFYCCAPDHPDTQNVLDRPRPIQITARMRTSSGYSYKGPILDWMRHRDTVVQQAIDLGQQGYKVAHGILPIAQYHKEVDNCSVGFNWEGFGRLNYRIPEYFRSGVVMITQPYGVEWPIREDVVLIHDENCVVCDRPEDFGAVARDLLADEKRLKRLRENVAILWKEKLSLPAMGQWYWEQIKKRWEEVSVTDQQTE